MGPTPFTHAVTSPVVRTPHIMTQETQSRLSTTAAYPSFLATPYKPVFRRSYACIAGTSNKMSVDIDNKGLKVKPEKNQY